ncbi:hypothetical protein VTJ49DRAFT_4160 [Mycothermus thermophilus]|uniref:Uncharacterized protein n=1 Tax=Humicola insolens TaxID=85995 RepID=A0ABR3V628_HUMIN
MIFLQQPTANAADGGAPEIRRSSGWTVPHAWDSGLAVLFETRTSCMQTVFGELGWCFNCTQVVGRFLAVLLELGALGFIAYLYDYWKGEPTTRVDLLVPSFAPVVGGVVIDTYELVSLLFLSRRRAINYPIMFFDVSMIAVGIFSFLVLGLVEKGSGRLRAAWAKDMTNAMIFMIIFTLLHAGFLVLAVAGIVYSYRVDRKKWAKSRLEKHRRTIVEFYQRRKQAASQPTVG